jgi:hypothetical protein
VVVHVGRAHVDDAAGSADAIMLARERLRNRTWPLRAARALGDDVP